VLEQRFAGDKSFVLRDGVWVDTAYQPGTETVKVAFGSDEYFALLARIPALAPYFAVGERVMWSTTGRRTGDGLNGRPSPAPPCCVSGREHWRTDVRGLAHSCAHDRGGAGSRRSGVVRRWWQQQRASPAVARLGRRARGATGDRAGAPSRREQRRRRRERGRAAAFAGVILEINAWLDRHLRGDESVETGRRALLRDGRRPVAQRLAPGRRAARGQRWYLHSSGAPTACAATVFSVVIRRPTGRPTRSSMTRAVPCRPAAATC
jgi:hypothetical protein